MRSAPTRPSQTRVVIVDLATDDAMATVADATPDLDIGMVMYNAGADPVFEPFLAKPVDVALAMVAPQLRVPMQMCHHFGAAMVERARAASCSSRRARASSARETWSPTARRRRSTW